MSLVTPTRLDFLGVLDGTNQVLVGPQYLDVQDQTGSGAGWNITLTSTQFTTTLDSPAVARTLDVAAASDSIAPTGACDVVATVTVDCTLGTSTMLYPIAIPAAAVTAPTAVKIQSAAVDTGLAGQTWHHVMSLAIPANTKAGVYSSTWTYSLISAP
jgi:hypothetical protein